MMAVAAHIPTICPTRNFGDSINPTQVIFETTKKRANSACKCDALSNNRKPWQERSSIVTSSIMILTRTTKSRRWSKACSNLDPQVFKKLYHVWESSTNEKQLRSLGSYFGRLQGGGNKKKMDTLKKIEVLDTGQYKAKKELQLLDAYFEKVDKETDTQNHTLGEQHEGESIFTSFPFEDQEIDDNGTQIRYEKREKLNDMIQRSIPKTTQLQEDEVCDLYLISTLVSVNIAVFLFEVASPVKNSDLPLFSLPSLYGAKINDLILVGEWWRLVTPMFLVQD